MSDDPMLYKNLQRLYPFDIGASPVSQVPPEIFCPVCGDTTTLHPFGDNVREGGHCATCAAFARQRAFAIVLIKALSEKTGLTITSLADPNIPDSIQIYSAEKDYAVHRQLLRLGGYQFGEFHGPQYKSGDVVDGIQHQDLMNTSYEDNSLDFVLTCDVFEHIPEPYVAHQEIYRILKPGGRHIFTVPSWPNMQMDDQRALVTPDGIEYLAPLEYHGAPLDQNLVYNVVGLEMIVELRGMGYEPIVWQLDDPLHGILGPYTSVYEAIKTYEPTNRPIPRGRRPRLSPVLAAEEPLAGAVETSVSLVVVTNDDPTLLRRCLQSFTSATTDNDELNVIVIQNGAPAQLDAELAGVSVIHLEEKQGLDDAFVEGLKNVKTDLALLATPDMVFERGFLSPLTKALVGKGSPDAVTPTVLREVPGEPVVSTVTAAVSSSSGVCLLMRLDSHGQTCEHIEASVVKSSVPTQAV